MLKLKKIEEALEEYKKGLITIGKAAEESGIGLREMMELANSKGINFQYSLSELKEDSENLE